MREGWGGWEGPVAEQEEWVASAGLEAAAVRKEAAGMEREVLAVATLVAGGTTAMEPAGVVPAAGAMGEAVRVASEGRVGQGVGTVDRACRVGRE